MSDVIQTYDCNTAGVSGIHLAWPMYIYNRVDGSWEFVDKRLIFNVA